MLLYQTTTCSATSKARIKEHVLPNSWHKITEFRSVFKSSLKKFYKILWHPFQRERRSVLNDMGVTNKGRIQTIMINIICPGIAVYVPMSITFFFHFLFLNIISFQKPSDASGSSCGYLALWFKDWRRTVSIIMTSDPHSLLCMKCSLGV